MIETPFIFILAVLDLKTDIRLSVGISDCSRIIAKPVHVIQSGGSVRELKSDSVAEKESPLSSSALQCLDTSFVLPASPPFKYLKRYYNITTVFIVIPLLSV